MMFSADAAWAVWVGPTDVLADGTAATVRTTRRECSGSGDTLRALDPNGTMHHVTAHGRGAELTGRRGFLEPEATARRHRALAPRPLAAHP